MLTWIGVSWRTCTSARRVALRALDALAPTSIILHTCARDAWLLRGDGARLQEAIIGAGFLASELDVRMDRAAVERLFEVAVGLDSAVEGEADVGRQVRAALAESDPSVVGVLDHTLARLLRLGRRKGWVREGQGVAALTVRALPTEGMVGVVGAGRLGMQVVRLLGDRAVSYNRTNIPGARPLSTLVPADVWVVATAAEKAWFKPPEPYRQLLDLGHPGQALPDERRCSLDTLLLGAQGRLPPSLLAAARRAVQAAADEWCGRLARRSAVAAQVSA